MFFQCQLFKRLNKIQEKMNSGQLNFIALIIIIGIVGVQTIRFSDRLFTPTNIAEYGRKYSQSQYVLGENSPQNISDADLYIYAGYAYVKGEDPTTINFEHPPLAKYLFGLSYYLTGNSLVFNIPLYIAVLFLFFLLSKKFINSFLLRMAAVVTLATLPLFSHLLPQALLDIPLLFTMLCFYLSLTWKSKKLFLKYCLVGLSLGIMACIKYPFPFMAVPLLFLAISACLQKEIRYALLVLPIMGSIYFLQYWGYFAHSHSLIDFINFEKYRFHWWTGNRTIPKFLIFENLFTGRHEAWWEPGRYLYTTEWTPLIPIIFVLSLPAAFLMKKNKWTLLLYGFSILILFLFALGSAASLRYLLITLPIWILAVFSGIERQTNCKQSTY